MRYLEVYIGTVILKDNTFRKIYEKKIILGTSK